MISTLLIDEKRSGCWSLDVKGTKNKWGYTLHMKGGPHYIKKQDTIKIKIEMLLFLFIYLDIIKRKSKTNIVPFHSYNYTCLSFS